MEQAFSRTILLFGEENLEILSKARVAVFGLGGVGSYVTEALARGGIGALDLVDNDTVALSNLNRQLYALHSTIGSYKTDVAAARVKDINPDIRVRTWQMFFLPDNADLFDFSQYDYVVDAIDTITAKIELAVRCEKAGVPIISSMGTGNKLDPTAFRVADIYRTNVCPLAKVMRRELKSRGVKHLKVVYSEELPLTPRKEETGEEPSEKTGSRRRQTPGSVSFVPSSAGLLIAGEVIKDLIRQGSPAAAEQ